LRFHAGDSESWVREPLARPNETPGPYIDSRISGHKTKQHTHKWYAFLKSQEGYQCGGSPNQKPKKESNSLKDCQSWDTEANHQSCDLEKVSLSRHRACSKSTESEDDCDSEDTYEMFEVTSIAGTPPGPGPWNPRAVSTHFCGHSYLLR